jgi:hypothetical protein
MTRKGVLALGAATGMFIAGTASAAFVGLFADSYSVTDPSNGVSYAVIDLYAQFDNTTGTVVSVFNANIGISNGTGFHHKDFNTADDEPGAWSPTLTGSAVNNRPYDSFVLIGGTTGGANTTSLDPNFSPNSGPFIPANAGWFNSNPPNLQGRVNSTTLRTWLGRFVSEGVTTSRNLNVTMTVSWNDGIGTPGGQDLRTGSFAYVPAPGAVALLALGGLVGGRRRRN